MDAESSSELEQLKADFDGWRKGRRHSREALPTALLERAQGAVETFGLARVFAATKFDRDRLRGKSFRPRAGTPAFSRVKVVAPVAMSQPFAELELPTGAKLRVFTQVPEVLHLLSALCKAGDAR
jgi:hypothetical protein